MKRIKWICTLGPKWQWLSGSPGTPGILSEGDNVREGVITLPPDKNYWYPCINVILQGVCTGNAYVCYYQEDGRDFIQAIAVAQGKWEALGPVGEKISESGGSGGITVLAEFAD